MRYLSMNRIIVTAGIVGLGVLAAVIILTFGGGSSQAVKVAPINLTPTSVRVPPAQPPTLLPAAVRAAESVGDCTPDTGWPTNQPDFATQVMALVNQHRASLGLVQLKVSPTLTGAAVWKARHMAEYSYMQHDDPAPPVARTWYQRVQSCGYAGTGAGENIAYGYSTPAAVMAGWLASPGHRANIENATYRVGGVGVATQVETGGGPTFWAQDFGTTDDSGNPPPPTTTTTTTPTTTCACTPTKTVTVTTTVGSPTTTPAVAVPHVPTNLRVAARSCTSITFAWDASAGADNYVLQRKGITSSLWTYLGQTALSHFTSFWTTNLTYVYRVAAQNMAGQSAYAALAVTRAC